MSVRATALFGAAALGACHAPPATAPLPPDMAITAALNDPARPAEDRARDATSKPVEVLTFFGVAEGMSIVDMNAALGWYTEILARVVGPTGHVIAQNHPSVGDTFAAEDFEPRYGGGRLPNVEQLFVRHNDLRLPANSVDVVLMSTIYHDIYWQDDNVDWGPIDREIFLAAVLAALKPGGVVGVVDHYAVAGADPVESVMAVHRIDRAVVERDFLAAGFEADGESDVLRSAGDDYSRSVFDADLFGRTDRFVLRFRKPR